MIRKRGIISTVIFVTFLVTAIPVASELFDIYNNKHDLDSTLVYGMDVHNDSDLFLQDDEEDTSVEKVSTLDEILEATEIEDYMVRLNQQNQGNITLSQNIYNIVVNGEMNEKKGENHSRNYISFDFYAPMKITEQTLENLRVTLPDSGDVVYTQRENQILERNRKGNLYFTLTQEFMSNQMVSVIVDWGDGKDIVYTLLFDVIV